MKIKIIILFLILINFVFMQAEVAEAKGIIIADDQKILEIFRDSDQNQIIELAQDIREYDKVILHLGSQKVFSRGHPFFYRTSKENLSIFARQLKKQDQKFYLWFLDSFGSEMFLNIYNDHQQIIDSNYQYLKKLDFDYEGLVIDLEWINLGLKAGSDTNQARYLEVLEYLKNKFETKELYAFMSIVNDQQENISRGYPEKEILKYLDNLIVMLYLKDSGFYLAEGELKMTLRDNRIDSLREYYQANNYQTAVSLEGGIFLERDEILYFIKTTNNFSYHEQSQLFYSNENKYYKTSGFILKKELILKRNDGQINRLKKGDRLHFLEINRDNLLIENDYIWEYFQMQK